MNKHISIFLLSITSIITYAAIPFTEQTLVPFFSGATPRLVSTDINIHGQAIVTWYESSNQWIGTRNALVATFYDPNSGWGPPQLIVDNQAGAIGTNTFYMTPTMADSGDAGISWFRDRTLYSATYRASNSSWDPPVFIDQFNGNGTRGGISYVNNINNTFTFRAFGGEFHTPNIGNSNSRTVVVSSNDSGVFAIITRERTDQIELRTYITRDIQSINNQPFTGTHHTSSNNSGNIVCAFYVINNSTNLQSIRATVYTPSSNNWSTPVQVGPEFQPNDRKNILVSLNNNNEALLIATTDPSPSDSNFGVFFSARLTDLENNTWETIPNTEPNDVYINIEQMTLGLGDNDSGIAFLNRLDANDPGTASTEYRLFTSTGDFPNQWRSFFTLYNNRFLSKVTALSLSIGPYGFAYNSAGNHFISVNDGLESTIVSSPSLFVEENLINRNIIVNPLLNVLGVGQDQPQNFTVQVYNTDYNSQRENFAQLSWEAPHIVSFEEITGYLIFHNQILIATLSSTQLSFDIHNIDTNESNEFRVEATFNGREASPAIITLNP